jgi:hypothetical protein
MIDLDRPTPTRGLAFSAALLYSLEQPRSTGPVRDDASLNLARGEAVSKGDRFQAHVYEGL